MKTNWMRALSQQFDRACREVEDKPLMLLSDIDGTIIDMRYLIRSVLQSYDAEHGTDFFEKLTPSDITLHENHIDQLLDALSIPSKRREDILAWYRERRWKPQAIREMNQPFPGALEVIRWFQLQPNTHVGLVTGRPEALREDTLSSLNQLGKRHRVAFSDGLLYMNPGDWQEDVSELKVAGLQHFREAGYHVFAVIDNEPANLKALASADSNKELLLLHADTIFETKRTRLPRGAVRGKDYRLSELIPDETALPSNIQLAWHGVNETANLRQFLASDVRWAEMDTLLDPIGREAILRHDSFGAVPPSSEERWLTLAEALDKLKSNGRAAKLDLKASGSLLELALGLVAEKGFSDSDLWFNASIERLMEAGFQRIVEAHPHAIIQCPVDFLVPLILATPKRARSILKMLTGWGLNRFSISWLGPDMPDVFDQMDRWGYEMNIYNVPDLEAFLQAVLLMPRSVTSDFNFPQWHYYGQGSGERGARHTYEIRKSKKRRRASARRD